MQGDAHDALHNTRDVHVTFYVQVLSSEFWPKDLLGLVEEGAAALHPTLQQVADAFTEQVSCASVARIS